MSLVPYRDAIFARAAERRQDRQEAEATARLMAETYVRLGYRIVTLPLAGIGQCAGFMAAHLRAG